MSVESAKALTHRGKPWGWAHPAWLQWPLQLTSKRLSGLEDEISRAFSFLRQKLRILIGFTQRFLKSLKGFREKLPICLFCEIFGLFLVLMSNQAISGGLATRQHKIEIWTIWAKVPQRKTSWITHIKRKHTYIFLLGKSHRIVDLKFTRGFFWLVFRQLVLPPGTKSCIHIPSCAVLWLCFYLESLETFRFVLVKTIRVQEITRIHSSWETSKIHVYIHIYIFQQFSNILSREQITCNDCICDKSNYIMWQFWVIGKKNESFDSYDTKPMWSSSRPFQKHLQRWVSVAN